MQRHVEVFQWEEKQVKFEETKGNMKRTGTRCEYHCHWMPAKDYINSFKFKDKKKVNIKPDLDDQKFNVL